MPGLGTDFYQNEGLIRPASLSVKRSDMLDHVRLVGDPQK